MPEAKIAFITEILSRTDRERGLDLSPLATDGLLAILREINDSLSRRDAAKKAGADFRFNAKEAQ